MIKENLSSFSFSCFFPLRRNFSDELENVFPVDFTGTIECDGYTVYPGFVGNHPAIIELVGCWAHEACDHASQHAGFILRQIADLYRIEARLRGQRASAKIRAVTRSCESRPIGTRIKKILLEWKTKHRFLPKSIMGAATDHALGQMPRLETYLTDGRVEIDNNLVENAIRPTAIGNKNWIFIGAASIPSHISAMSLHGCSKAG